MHKVKVVISEVSHSLYIQHHVGDGLLSVLLTVVEENLLAAHHNVLETEQTL